MKITQFFYHEIPCVSYTMYIASVYCESDVNRVLEVSSIYGSVNRMDR